MRFALHLDVCISCFLVSSAAGQCVQSLDAEGSEVSGLLQLQVNAASPSSPRQARMEKIKPVAFLHVPKAGSTFFNVLYNHPAICALAPKGLAMGRSTLVRHPPAQLCEGGWSTSFAAIPHSQRHWGISLDNWQKNKGHFVTMLRQPEQRLLSHWHYNASHPGFAPGHASNIHEFAEQMQGCAVKMLTQGGRSPTFPGGKFRDSSPCFDVTSKPNMAMAHEAVQRLREGFAFVGLTDKWQLSVCLFHAMYGAKCNDVEFQDVNRQRQNTTWDVAGLQGFHDPFDGLLYEEAQRIFHEKLELYGVTEESCPSSCL